MLIANMSLPLFCPFRTTQDTCQGVSDSQSEERFRRSNQDSRDGQVSDSRNDECQESDEKGHGSYLNHSFQTNRKGKVSSSCQLLSSASETSSPSAGPDSDFDSYLFISSCHCSSSLSSKSTWFNSTSSNPICSCSSRCCVA